MQTIQEKIEQLKEFISNRMIILLLTILVMFFVLVIRLVDIQIIHGAEYSQSVTASTSKTLAIEAPRGNIYDRYGRPLAINHVAYSIQLDNSVSADFGDNRNQLIKQFCDEIWLLDGSPKDNLPIDENYKFNFDGTTEEDIKLAEINWKNDLNLPEDLMNGTAIDVLNYLYEIYEAPTEYSELQKRAYVSYVLDMSNNNILALTLATKFMHFGENLIDDLPLEKEYPYAFHYTTKNREIQFKESMSMKDEQLDYTSLETLEYLGEFFGLPKDLPTDILRSAVGIRYSIYLQYYQQYQLITLATQINTKTLSYFEENQDVFLNVSINPISLREYPEGEYFSHLLGYIRKMTTEDYALYAEDVDENGNKIYTQNDVVGQAGFEKLYERDLNGTDGKVFIEVDNLGRRMSILDETEPIAGKDVFLTLDSRLQKVAYDTLEAELAKAVASSLSGRVTLNDLFVSMVSSNNISAKKIMNSTSGTSNVVYNRFLEAMPDFNPSEENAKDILESYLLDEIVNNRMSHIDCISIAVEQGTIIATQDELSNVQNGGISHLGFILDKLGSGELTASDTGLDPSTGSVFVTKIDSGETLASVTYPSYDNNEFVNEFNNSYYNDLLADTNTPLVNRPLQQKKAPGSTFKMIPLLAGLETNAITGNTVYQDRGIFTDAGSPHARCWIYNSGRTHGSVDVVRCLEVSCNYFMYQMAYNMGNATNGGTAQTITTLNEYMASFGLNKTAGLELSELSPTMASPHYKERIILTANPDATSSQLRWTDGDTIRAVIGQSVNSYTPAQMTKYISTLANGGTLYKLHMVESIKNPDGSIYEKVEEVVENISPFDESNLELIYRGMYQVTKGSEGTMRGYFRDYPINIATKTGTAQEALDRNPHSWLVCFAPYEEPQIAITVMIPFGDGHNGIAPAIVKAVIDEYFNLEYEGEGTHLETILNQ